MKRPKKPRKGRKNPLSVHHRKPRSLGGTDHPENISIIGETQHRAWHILFGNEKPEQIAELINTHYIDPAYQLVVKRR